MITRRELPAAVAKAMRNSRRRQMAQLVPVAGHIAIPMTEAERQKLTVERRTRDVTKHREP